MTAYGPKVGDDKIKVALSLLHLQVQGRYQRPDSLYWVQGGLVGGLYLAHWLL